MVGLGLVRPLPFRVNAEQVEPRKLPTLLICESAPDAQKATIACKKLNQDRQYRQADARGQSRPSDEHQRRIAPDGRGVGLAERFPHPLAAPQVYAQAFVAPTAVVVATRGSAKAHPSGSAPCCAATCTPSGSGGAATYMT